MCVRDLRGLGPTSFYGHMGPGPEPRAQAHVHGMHGHRLVYIYIYTYTCVRSRAGVICIFSISPYILLHSEPSHAAPAFGSISAATMSLRVDPGEIGASGGSDLSGAGLNTGAFLNTGAGTGAGLDSGGGLKLVSGSGPIHFSLGLDLDLPTATPSLGGGFGGGAAG